MVQPIIQHPFSGLLPILVNGHQRIGQLITFVKRKAVLVKKQA